MKDLSEIFGKSYTPQELAQWLNLDPRTVNKYADRWGGVEVAPGKMRFFEKRIKEVINAVQTWNEIHWTDKEEREEERKGVSDAERGKTPFLPHVHGHFSLLKMSRSMPVFKRLKLVIHL